jgi:type IV secretion system protein VirD4
MVPTGVLIGQITMVFATTLLGLWSATQWTAAALGYQMRLGVPWFVCAR